MRARKEAKRAQESNECETERATDPTVDIIADSHQNRWPVGSNASRPYTRCTGARSCWAVRGQAGPEVTATTATSQAHQVGTEAIATKAWVWIPCTHLGFRWARSTPRKPTPSTQVGLPPP